MKYTENDINRIRRTFKNFNKKVRYNKTKTRGRGMLPQRVSASVFMDKYSDKSRKEMEKQLKLYQSFGSKDALDLVGNNRISKWEERYFVNNLIKTKKFYDK